ncbi:Structure-specific endonuclease, subunit SLX4 [Moelleriella libera RCEF 2490]|uniref:Structure-specific endonuclease subunit SLX4 n=1 Tax=Moelleriella libera RCEF 2490 TaxID=1081109 RepID=A0A166U2S2_9HYPO|nr:Structure-specific endonuclease, subunit SLX4 [Moelleriella libera RCEF 2490]
MASPDVFLSSPSRTARHFVIPSSSPDLPSVQEFLSSKLRRPAVKSGSRAMPIPDDAPSTFTSARNLWKSVQASEIHAQSKDHPIEVDDGETSTPVTASASLLEPRPRQRRQVQIQEVNGQGNGAEMVKEKSEQPWRKFKPTTPDRASRCEPTATNTAPSAAPDISKDVVTYLVDSPEQAPPLSAPPASPPLHLAPVRRQDILEPLLLEPAMTRRKDWTPPPPQVDSLPQLDSSPREIASTDSKAPDRQASFGNMISGFRCASAAAFETATLISAVPAVSKRKLDHDQGEETIVDSCSVSPKPVTKPKPKKSRKKPRTITSVATAAYKPLTQPDDVDEPQEPALPTAYRPTTRDGSKPKARKRPSKTKRKAKLPEPVLFSPETALRQVAHQDFVFGTSSQLAGEHSPTFLKNLQRAMAMSNELDTVQCIEPLNSDVIEPPESRPKLWDAATRDADGDLFDLEVINLTETDSGAAHASNSQDPFGYVRGDEKHSSSLRTDTVQISTGTVAFIDISETPVKAAELAPGGNPTDSEKITARNDVLPSQQTSSETQSFEGADLPLFSQAASCATAETEPVPGNEKRPPPVTFEHFTDAQLAKEVSRFGFKPIKRRSTMIALLEKCWQQRNGIAATGQVRAKSAFTPSQRAPPLGSPSPKRPRGRPRKNSSEDVSLQEPPPSAQAPQTPKRPRGRPRKQVEANPSEPRTPVGERARAQSQHGSVTPQQHNQGAKVIEIADSESESVNALCPSSDSSPSSILSSPGAIDLTKSMNVDTETSVLAAPTDAQQDLFDCITKAVTTAPRTNDVSQPSWHEKILLYDPIVLEELAAWLNSGQLSRVGFDDEINPGDLKKWCQSKSICCLWKVNLHGKERKRY